MKAIHSISLALLAVAFMSGSAFAGDKNKSKKPADKRERWERRFDRIDANDDGSISQQEFLAFKETQQARRQDRKAKKAAKAAN